MKRTPPICEVRQPEADASGSFSPSAERIERFPAAEAAIRRSGDAVRSLLLGIM